MQLPALITSDLHLTASPADSYRWSLFPWLADHVRRERVKSVIILGDLTDAKDYHPAELTNQLVAEIIALSQLAHVTILMGNHDYLKSGLAYFKFLELTANIRYITKPTEDLDGEPCYWLPHSKNPLKDWEGMRDFSHYSYIFMHQTIKGSIASNGMAMDGDALPDMTTAGKIYSGDIHVPQIIANPVIGSIEYVGSPYHVHFGDRFNPRVILINRTRIAVDLHFNTISRTTLDVGSLRELKRLKLHKGDQVKLRIALSEADKHDWARIRREAQAWLKEEGVEIEGVELKVKKARRVLLEGRPAMTPADAITRYVEAEELGGSMLEVGLECLDD